MAWQTRVNGEAAHACTLHVLLIKRIVKLITQLYAVQNSLFMNFDMCSILIAHGAFYLWRVEFTFVKQHIAVTLLFYFTK